MRLASFLLGLFVFSSACAAGADLDTPLKTEPVVASEGGQVAPEVTNLTPSARNIAALQSGAERSQLDSVSKKNTSSLYKKRELPESEFQKFVASSRGKKLPIFGHELFRAAPDTFAPVEGGPVTSDYVIGPGDELLITVWGQVEANATVVVDRNGVISLPKVGIVNVAGIPYSKLARHLKTQISRNYRNFELDVSLGKLRSIQVFVFGQAAAPGVYTISSLSSLVNALFASGGPSPSGSMRHIQLKRSDKVVTEFDVYDLLLKGDKSKDVPLLPGDVIFIPPVGATAAMMGSVNNPAIFELKQGETFANLLQYAGGLSSLAEGRKVTVERISNRDKRVVETLELTQSGLAKSVIDGDVVEIREVSSKFENAVVVKGNVANPGRYPWQEGLKVSDLLPNQHSLIVDQYWVTHNQLANKSDVKLESKSEVDRREMFQQGESELEKKVVFERQLPEVNWDYAVIERINPDDLTPSLIPFNLGKAIKDKDPQNDLLLQAGDVITIFSKSDIKVPAIKKVAYVTLEGEFMNPGVYQVLPGETLPELVNRVGGISGDAYLLGAEFTRLSTKALQQKRLDEIVQRLESSVMGLTGNEDKKDELEAQKTLLFKMKQVKALGRIVLELDKVRPTVEDLPILALEDGDRIFVPAKPSIVHVMGTVYNQNAFVYKAGLKVSDYLAKAGGPTPDGDGSNVYLVRVDGTVISKQQSSFFYDRFSSREMMPGDTIIVPEKLDDIKWSEEAKTWTQIFYQFAVGVASLKTIGVF